MSQVPDSKYITYRNLVQSTKDGGATAQTTRKSITGKFSSALDNAQEDTKKDRLKESKDKVLKSEGLISANITNPANNPIKKIEE